MEYQKLAGIIVASSFIVFYLLELIGGKIQSSPRPLRDFSFTLVGIFSQSFLSAAIVGSAMGYALIMLLPNKAGSLSTTPLWLAFPILFLINEFMHYWLHRKAHEWRWLWKIHRTHHSAQELNTGVLYRYNIFWVLIIPHTWTGTAAVYLGLGLPFIIAILTTYFINALTHTSYRWDLWLREKFPMAEPFWKIIEKIITLPDAHHAHHAYGKSAHPNGNYAISLFIFDTLFGTAKIPNSRQKKYGLPISPRLHWAEELFWPMIKKPLLAKPDTNSSIIPEAK
jgi:sterol desaturase/sphingolipid hydroxylase (fatty acid hydroxylase superfamily)